MKKQNLRKYLVLAMFTALAYISLLVMKIGGIGGFLTFDIKDAVITIAAMQFGPISAIVISLLVSFIEMITISGTGPWGFLMNFIGSAAFAALASAIYLYMPRVKKTLMGAVVGLVTAAVAMTGLMLVMNIFITPIYTHAPLEAIYDMMLPLLLPFNLIKAVANAAIVFVLYKPLCVALRKIHVMDGNTVPYRVTAKTVVFLVLGLLVLIACILLLVLTFGGRFEWFKA
ncbi:MAG: ECF transporter S component [Clostridia bacterium]|nr:ECF transporter S component [Clostridia bacterium]